MPDANGELQTGVSVILRDAVNELEPVHRELHPVHAAKGIPLHITLLYPFISRHLLTEDHERRLEDLFATQQPIAFDLVKVESFASVVYAVPFPDNDLRALMRLVWRRFPETPPYEGAFSDPPPHATLALIPDQSSPVSAAAQLAARLDGTFPLRCNVQDVSLMEEREPDRWREARRFRLGGIAA